MALRDPQAVLGTFINAGVLCLAPSARTCIAHGLPETPDSFSYTPLIGGATGAVCVIGHAAWFVESWDAPALVFVNSTSAGIRGYLRAAVEYAVIF